MDRYFEAGDKAQPKPIFGNTLLLFGKIAKYWDS